MRKLNSVSGKRTVERWRAWKLAAAGVCLWAGNCTAATPGELAADVVTEEFTVSGGAETIVVQLQSPAKGRIATRPLLLLNFSTDRPSSLAGGRYGEPARLALEAGHRVASFDLPAHGDRIDARGSGIVGLCARLVAGDDPFAQFVNDGRAAIDECIRRKLAEAGRIVACGVSRAGYCALRLAADDPRVAAVAGLAPVTDWREVREFASVRGRSEVAALALTHCADRLAGRRVYVAIGNLDSRVSTEACTRFMLALAEAERRGGLSRSRMRYVIADDTVDHALAPIWRREGVVFLLSEATRESAR